jgi:D-alanine-D-alanine ligase
VIPGLTETSLVPLAIEASETDASTVYSGLAHRAAARAS